MFNLQIFVPLFLGIPVLVIPSIITLIDVLKRKEKKVLGTFIFLVICLIPLCISSAFYGNYQKDIRYAKQLTAEIHELVPKFTNDVNYYVEEFENIKNYDNYTLNINQDRLSFEFKETDSFPVYFNRNYKKLANFTIRESFYDTYWDNELQQSIRVDYQIIFTQISIDALKHKDDPGYTDLTSITIYDLFDSDVKITSKPDISIINQLEINLESGNYEVNLYEKFNVYSVETIESNDDWALPLLICSAVATVLNLISIILVYILTKKKNEKAEKKYLENKNIKGENSNMVYNKTKRLLELIAGICGVAFGTGTIGASLYLFITGIILSIAYVPLGLPFLIPGIILLTTSICSLVFGALLIKTPVRPEGVLNRKKIQICLIVFSILSGNIISFVLEIIVLNLPNFVDGNLYAEKNNSKYIQPNPQITQSQNMAQNGVESKINELKHLKELGVIDEETYNKAIDKLISEIR